MHYEESPKVSIEGHNVYPYARFDDAFTGISEANEHFGEKFTVRQFHEPNKGYVLVSKTRILDNRDFAISISSPLEKSLEAYKEYIKQTFLATS